MALTDIAPPSAVTLLTPGHRAGTSGTGGVVCPNEPVEAQGAREAHARLAEYDDRVREAARIATKARREANAAGERQRRRDAEALSKLRPTNDKPKRGDS